MELIKVTESHLQSMMEWFPDQQTLKDWAGPGFRYPYDEMTFREDLNLDQLVSRALVSDGGELLGFGQFYSRLGRCHLGRLVVNPGCRGQGVVDELINQLAALGMPALQTTECSLFVLQHNRAAVHAYQRNGFEQADYPEQSPMDNCIYMVKTER
ncbi:MAG: GNAT family N-acetyltransferase [Amphritea sp.]|nr:GNAT family N-acetyltransferase [Amphritea sp.]